MDATIPVTGCAFDIFDHFNDLVLHHVLAWMACSCLRALLTSHLFFVWKDKLVKWLQQAACERKHKGTEENKDLEK